MQANIVKRNIAHENVPEKYVRIKSVESIGKADVYNMEVDNVHNFSVNGGLIVHNCMDSMRYLVHTLNVTKKKSEYRPLLGGI